MLDFDFWANKIGIDTIQKLIEWGEPHQGIKANSSLTLEERWNTLMFSAPETQQRMAA